MGVGASVGTSAKDDQAPGALRLELALSCVVDAEAIISTAEAAGRAILAIYNSDSASWGVELKSDASPVTKADIAANSIICSELMRLTPHIPVVSEETPLLPHDVRKGFQYFWLVDPLDGTKEFLKRNGEFTVNIALMGKDGPVLGVVHVPCTSKTYWAVKGQGAWLRNNGAKDVRLKVAQFKLDQPGLKIVGSNSHSSAETKEFVDMFKGPELKQVGSSIKLLMVAEGSAHMYPRMAPTCEWDTAAADIVVQEAGGVVLQAGLCDNQGKALEDWREALAKEIPVKYNKPDILNPYFVVFGERISA